jgi:hypothetical protein
VADNQKPQRFRTFAEEWFGDDVYVTADFAVPKDGRCDRMHPTTVITVKQPA